MGTNGYSRWQTWLYHRFATPAMAGHRDHLRRRLVADLPRGARILDVGCGAGDLLAEVLAARADCSGVGLDPSAAALALARRRHPSLALVRARLEEAPFAAATFTAATAVGVLKHCPDPVAALAHLRHLVAADGQAILVEIDAGADAARCHGWVTNAPRFAGAIVRRLIRRHGLEGDRLAALTAAAGWTVRSREAHPDLPLLSLILGT